jgi:hypothetical protein
MLRCDPGSWSDFTLNSFNVKLWTCLLNFVFYGSAYEALENRRNAYIYKILYDFRSGCVTAGQKASRVTFCDLSCYYPTTVLQYETVLC